MSRVLFGTDGIRGVANKDLSPELAFNLGQAAARWLKTTHEPKRLVVGRDTRRSGGMLEAALAAGFCSLGVDVVSIGVAPTPTVSFVARTGSFGLGAIVSASHNPAPDNGIKFVGHDGRKLPDETEEKIEGYIKTKVEERLTGGDVGQYAYLPAPIEAYVAYLKSLVPEGLAGLSVAVDCAHGAAYHLGPRVLEELGATVVRTGTEPDGMNINAAGGATKPETICSLTVEAVADIGVAFDGDADRCVFSDEKGALINGDRAIGIWSAFHQADGDLEPAAVVGTVMSNGGFEAYLKGRGIELHRSPVGDKYVAAKMAETGALVGGEQSGHIIFTKRGPTGDGLITMLEVLRVLRRSGKAASEWTSEYDPWPQVLFNLSVPDASKWKENASAQAAVSEAEQALSGHGRINVRASGTQPIVRVMVEADSYDLRDAHAKKVVETICKELGGSIYSQVDLTHALGD